MFDLTINLGSILTMAAFIVFITIYISSGRAATKVLDTRLELIDAQMEDFRLEMKKLTDVFVAQATQSGRIDRVEDRQLSEGKRIDGLEVRLNKYVDVVTRP